jgi:hypothetical protein
LTQPDVDVTALIFNEIKFLGLNPDWAGGADGVAGFVFINAKI